MSASVSSNRVVLSHTSLRVLGAIILFGLLFWIVNPEQLIATLLRADMRLVAVIWGFAAVWLLLGALNIWILLRGRSPITLASFGQIYVMSWSLGLLVPGQFGDATQVLFLRHRGFSAASGMAAYTIDKAVSLCLLGSIGIYGILRYSAGMSPWQALTVSAAASIIAACTMFASARLIRSSLLPPRLRSLLASLSREAASIASQPTLIGLNAFISVIKWLVMAAMYYVAFSALSVPIHFEPAATIPVISSLVAYIPITIAGIGVTEWTAVGLFHHIGIGPINVLAAYLIMRGVLISCAAAILVAGRLSRHAAPD